MSISLVYCTLYKDMKRKHTIKFVYFLL